MSSQNIYNFLAENRGKCYSVNELSDILGICKQNVGRSINVMISWNEIKS